MPRKCFGLVLAAVVMAPWPVIGQVADDKDVGTGLVKSGEANGDVRD